MKLKTRANIKGVADSANAYQVNRQKWIVKYDHVLQKNLRSNGLTNALILYLCFNELKNARAVTY
jgi:hypothetical protein